MLTTLGSGQGQNGDFNPLLLSPQHWLDGNDKTKLSTSDNLATIVDTITTKGASMMVSVPYSSGAVINKLRYNGEGLYNIGKYGFTLGSTSDFNYLHNSGGFNLYLVFKQLPLVDASNPYPILRTSTGATQAGISISYYNRSATSNQKTLNIFISNGSGGTAQFLINCTANCIEDNKYHVLKLKFTGTALTAFVKKEGGNFVNVGSDATGVTSSGNSANPLLFGTTGVGWKGYFKHLLTFNRQLNAIEESQMDDWATVEMSKQVIETPLKIYLSANAQSNFWGRGLNSAIASELNGAVGGLVYYPVNNSNYNSASVGLPYWAKLQVGVTSNPDFGETVHGFANRFGYEMKQFSGEDVAILGYAVSSTRLATTAGQADWNVNSVETGDLFPKWRDFFLPYALDDMKHVMRRTPDFRGLFPLQGEADASYVGGGVTYQMNQEAEIKAMIDRINALGYSTAKMRVMIIRIANSYGSYDAIALNNVRTGQVNVGTQSNGVDFSGYISANKMKSITWISTDGKALNGDNLHYSAAGVDSIGMDLKNYYKDYINE